MPTPNQPIHLEHLRFALALERNRRMTLEMTTLQVADRAKELILAARAARRMRSLRERQVILARMRDLSRPFGLLLTGNPGSGYFLTDVGQTYEIPR